MNDPDRRFTSDGFDADAMFADIVAHIHDDDIGAESAETPAAEDGTAREVTAERGMAENAGDSAAVDRPPDERSSPLANHPGVFPPDHPGAVPVPQVWRAYDVDDEYEEHFEPPPVAPLPMGDLQFWAIIAGMCGGPLLLLYLMIFNRNAGSSWTLTSIALSLGGFALLVLRLPRDHEDDDDGIRL